MTSAVESELRVLFGEIRDKGYARISVSLQTCGPVWLASSAHGVTGSLVFKSAEDDDPIEALRKLFYAPHYDVSGDLFGPLSL